MRENIVEARPPLLNTDHSVSPSIVAPFSDAIQANRDNLGAEINHGKSILLYRYSIPAVVFKNASRGSPKEEAADMRQVSTLPGWSTQHY